MKSPQRKRFSVIAAAAAFLLLTAADAPNMSVRLNMSRQQVVERLGEPDRRAVLDGKTLRQIDAGEEAHLSSQRIVYDYDATGTQVWFKDGKVTGVMQRGVSTH